MSGMLSPGPVKAFQALIKARLALKAWGRLR